MAKTKTQAESGVSSHPVIPVIEGLRGLCPRAEKRSDGTTRSVPADRATLAKLRRGLGKDFGEPGAAERDGWVLMRVPSNCSKAELDRCCLIASLFAMHPEPQGAGTLATAFRKLWEKQKEAESVERRFVALLNSDPADLPLRLRHAVSLMKSNDITFGWQRLLKDLRGWSDASRYVQRRWAKDFWGQSSESKEDESDTPESS